MDEFSFKDVINGSENYWNEKGKKLESKENPKVYFLGGQSGAGKSKLKDRIGKENLVIDVDEFRKYQNINYSINIILILSLIFLLKYMICIL